ncbi:MAG: M14 family metallopeptidase [Planctomycetaceae bacterium]
MRRATTLLLLTALARAGAESRPILPPVAPWDGASRALVRDAADPWITPTEASGFLATPRYDETVAWLERLAAATPLLKVVSIGRSPEGRDLWLCVMSKEGAGTAIALKANGRPTLFAQGGIHSGEIDGKDAGMMLLRDLAFRPEKRALLDKANLLFLPIFSVDGHERFGPGRINQNGPALAGWRTTSRNLNLNRDYAKLDSPEMRGLVRALDAWDPDLYFDIHVTNGADYQYDITWGHNGRHAWSPAIAAWLEESLTPELAADLRAMGHVPGPLVFPVDARDLTKGNNGATMGPRFSNGYGDARQIPTLLVENHSLKPFEQRVLGTYVLLESALRTLGRGGGGLRAAIAADRARRPARLPLSFRVPQGEPKRVAFLGIASELVPSAISGALRTVWTGRPIALEIPNPVESEPLAMAERPKAYWIPPAWGEVIERLALHGIRMERFDTAREVEVEATRIVEPTLGTQPFEGHVQVRATFRTERRRERFAPGSVRVPTDQPLGSLAMLLLEPASPDSFFAWGFFLECLQRTEYADDYVMEAMAEAMLAEDEALRREFAKKLEVPAFAQDSAARLDWFYAKTPFADARWLLYPVMREE